MTTTSKTTYQVIEDNGGGLHLYVWDGDELVYAHCGYEHSAGDLAACVKALVDGETTEDWEGCEDDPQASYDGWTDESRSNGGWAVIIDETGPRNVSKWGAAALREWPQVKRVDGESDAEYIAHRMGGKDWDGKSWTSALGEDLSDACRQCGGMREESDDSDTARYILDDGSKVVSYQSYWDIGFSDCDCYCSKDAGHHPTECSMLDADSDAGEAE